MPRMRDPSAWLQGGDVLCRKPPASVQRAWRLVLLGPPGAGKGTQAGLLESVLGACTLSTGELCRPDHSRPAPPGSALAQAQTCTLRGENVPDGIALALLQERRHCLQCSGGFMLDGFPRTVAQAQALDLLLASEAAPLDAAIHFELSPEQITERLVGRRVCPHCREMYHLTFRPPHIEAICDLCHHPLTQRREDQPEAIHARLAAYRAESAPVLAYYRARGLLIPIDAWGGCGDILARTLDALAALRPTTA